MKNYVFTISIFSPGSLSFAILIILPLKTSLSKNYHFKNWNENRAEKEAWSYRPLPVDSQINEPQTPLQSKYSVH